MAGKPKLDEALLTRCVELSAPIHNHIDGTATQLSHVRWQIRSHRPARHGIRY
jgi:hypothetical protein